MISIFSQAMFFIGIIFLALFFYSLSRYRNRVSGYFAFICLSEAIYLIGYAFELRAQSVEEIIFFLKMEYFGLPFMLAFLLLFSYKFYANREPSLLLSMLFFVIPFITLFLNVTNEHHHLFYANVTAVEYNGFLIARLHKGPWYYVHVLFSYAAIVSGLFLLFKAFRNSHENRRKQSLIIIVGTVVPGVMEVVYLAGLSPLGLDLMPFASSVMAICVYMALFRYDLLKLEGIIQSAVFSEINEGIIVVDNKNKLIDFNRAARLIYDWLTPDCIGMELASAGQAKNLMASKEAAFEVEVARNGASKYYQVHMSAIKEKDKVLGSVYVLKETTQIKEMIRELDFLASYDFLTQAYNRRRFFTEAEQILLHTAQQSGQLSLMMIDIDRFKEVNDTYGHLAGDEVLKSVVGVCKKNMRETDIIGRFGGEEFAVLLPGADLADSAGIAERIRACVEDYEIIYFTKTIKVTVCIGITTVGAAEKADIYKMIYQADEALYRAKSSGRNHVFLCSSLRAQEEVS